MSRLRMPSRRSLHRQRSDGNCSTYAAVNTLYNSPETTSIRPSSLATRKPTDVLPDPEGPSMAISCLTEPPPQAPQPRQQKKYCPRAAWTMTPLSISQLSMADLLDAVGCPGPDPLAPTTRRPRAHPDSQ